ncbi:MAG: hypothetical protein HY513_04530 [Candidatus Aenigmarchaeota archaeon]|nr:hypothetical protein [Candidatus Aenigmarchaeota archaeon]
MNKLIKAKKPAINKLFKKYGVKKAAIVTYKSIHPLLKDNILSKQEALL